MAYRFGLAAALSALVISAAALAHGVAPEDAAALADGGGMAYLWLGAKHMVTGYDHLLFLLGVVFFLQRPLDIVKFVTAFTLGHSITLILGTLAQVTINYFLVDAFIALTVCYKAVENLDGFRRWLGVASPSLLGAVFVFGLVHGLGLATRLQQMPLPETGLVSRILWFNLGVELGQIAALAVMLTVLAVWRRRESFARTSRLANQAMVLAGGVLFLMQLHGYLHATRADDLGFSQDLHHHAHDAMEQAAQRESHQDSLD
jgi:hypothetical protein